MASGALNRLALGGLGLAAGAFLVDQSMYNVEGGHRAVIFDRIGGVKEKIIGEGTHFVIPWLQRPIIYDTRLRPRVIQTVTGTKDLQNVNVTLRVLCRPEKESLPWIYKNYGLDYDERVLPSIGNEVLKAVVAQFNADQLLTQRDRVSRQVRDGLTRRSEDFKIMLDDVSITHLTFSNEYAAAIERKQIAQQQAEKSKFIVMRTEQERQAAVIRAEGEAEAANRISRAVKENGTGMIELRKIEAAKDIAGDLSNSRNITYLPGGGQNLLLNVQ